MTTQLIDRPATTPAPASTIGFGNLMHSEWTKLRSVRSTYWTVIAAALSTVALAVVICIRFRQLIGQDGPGKLDGFDPTLTSLNGIYLAQIAIGTLGVLVITSEYATGMIRATFSAVPQRRAVLAAKALVFAGATFVLGELISFAAFGIGQAILSGAHPDLTRGFIGADGGPVDLARDFPGLHTSASLADPGVFRAVFGAGLYLAAVGLLGLGLGAMIRHTAGALSAFFGLLFGASVITALLPTNWRNDLMPYLPANAGSQIFTIVPTHDALAPWSGLGVFCLYAVAALIVGFVLVGVRDA
jgi:ABC-2 type transport system permease protein